MQKLIDIFNRLLDFLISYLSEILGLVAPKDDETAGE